MLAGVLITGAFHEDGLADTADAIAGGWTRERRLEILKDPRHGSYGVAALCGSIVLRVLAVASLGPAAAVGGLVAAHALGRGAAVVTMGVVPVARPDGLGAEYARSVGAGRAAAAGVVAAAIAVAATGWWAGPLVLAAAVGAVGGHAGDAPRVRRHHRRHPRRHRAGRRVPRARHRDRAGGPPRRLVELTVTVSGGGRRVSRASPRASERCR